MPGPVAGTETVMEGIERSGISVCNTYWNKLRIHMSLKKKKYGGEKGDIRIFRENQYI